MGISFLFSFALSFSFFLNYLYYPLQYFWASLVAQLVKNPPAMQETWVQPLGWEDPLEKGMATRSSILAWRIPRTEEPGGLQSMGSQTVTHDLVRNTSNQKMCVSKDSLKHKSAASDSHMCTFQNNISIFSCSAGKTESKLSEAYGILSNFFIPIW